MSSASVVDTSNTTISTTVALSGASQGRSLKLVRRPRNAGVGNSEAAPGERGTSASSWNERPSPQPSLGAVEREVRAVAHKISQAAVEVLAGTRPAQQLSRWLSPRCYSALTHRAALTRAQAARNRASGTRLHRNPQVRSVRACAITVDICEASIVVSEDLRARAVAMRLERTDEAWRITELEIG